MNRVIYFNNKFVNEKKAVVPITTHALHYGTGCFEGIRAYYSNKEKCLYVFRMEDHFKRLLNSAKLIYINIDHSVEDLCKITEQLLRKNFQETDIYIRPIAYKADPAVGNFNLKTLQDGFAIYTVALGRYLNIDKGIRANVSSWQRISDNSIPPRGKITGAYINTSLAKTESLLNGYEEALLLDGRGHIVEGSAENIFIVKNGVVVTPPVTDDILEGITRETVIEIFKEELGMQVEERSIDRSEIYSAGEVLLVGTGAEISSVIEVDQRKIGDGEKGMIGRRVQEIYSKMVHGELEKYQKYLTKITK